MSAFCLRDSSPIDVRMETVTRTRTPSIHFQNKRETIEEGKLGTEREEEGLGGERHHDRDFHPKIAS